MDVGDEQFGLAAAPAIVVHKLRGIIGNIHIGKVTGITVLRDCGGLGGFVIALLVVLAQSELSNGIRYGLASRATEIMRNAINLRAETVRIGWGQGFAAVITAATVWCEVFPVQCCSPWLVAGGAGGCVVGAGSGKRSLIVRPCL